MKGRVVYYQDESQPPNRAWKWRYVSIEGQVISHSDGCFKTRRGAVDDFNQIESVVNRLKKGMSE